MFRFFVYLYTRTQPNFPHPQWAPTEGRSFTWFICFLIKFENARFSNTLPALRIQPFTRRTIPVTRDIPMIRKWFPPLFEVFINLEPRVTAAWLAGVLIRDRWLLNRNTHLKSRAQGYSLSAVRSPGMVGTSCMGNYAWRTSANKFFIEFLVESNSQFILPRSIRFPLNQP